MNCTSPKVSPSQIVRLAVLSIFVLDTSGCSHSPSFNILGSYFPSWILCCAIAAVLTLVMHGLFVRWKLLDELWPVALLYPALLSFFSCTLWLIFFY